MDMSEIIPKQLWVGAAPTRVDLSKVKEELGNGLVILDLNRSPEEEKWCRELGILYDERVPRVEDSPGPVSVAQLNLIARIVEDQLSAGRKVFLHCTAGRGRSPTCAAAYLIRGGMSLSEARRYVSEKRSVWAGDDAKYSSSLEQLARMQEMAHIQG